MRTKPRDGSEKPARIPVYILAGGKSRRYGSDKARADAGGQPLIVGVARALEPVASRITVVAAVPGAYDDLGLRTIADIAPERGPMGGLQAALEDNAVGGWILLSACDWKGIRREWLELLLSERRDGREAIAFRAKRYDPLLALYHGSILAAVTDRIERNDLEMHELLASLDTRDLPHPPDWRSAVNVNRPL